MPLRSMTGYASAAGSVTLAASTWQVRAEVRSVNSRFLELKSKHALGAEFDDAIRRVVETKLSRGRVDLSLHAAMTTAVPPGNAALVLGSSAGLGVEPGAVRALAQALAATQAESRLEGVELPLPNALECLRFIRSQMIDSSTTPGANGDLTVAATGVSEQRQQLWEIHRSVLTSALDALVIDRTREGAGLQQKLRELLADLRDCVAALSELARVEPSRIFERARQRLALLGQTVELPAQDQERLLQEVAIVVTKADVTEEVARLELHMDHVAERLESDVAAGVGKSLDFAAQELMRECTTLGAKLSHPDAGRLVIDAKGCVERIREQVQNVE